jgi:hypothetical protein
LVNWEFAQANFAWFWTYRLFFNVDTDILKAVKLVFYGLFREFITLQLDVYNKFIV